MSSKEEISNSSRSCCTVRFHNSNQTFKFLLNMPNITSLQNVIKILKALTPPGMHLKIQMLGLNSGPNDLTSRTGTHECFT